MSTRETVDIKALRDEALVEQRAAEERARQRREGALTDLGGFDRCTGWLSTRSSRDEPSPPEFAARFPSVSLLPALSRVFGERGA
jgi:hypothetical protein